MWKEFKEFAFRGNVLDMAIGVIIGGAFGKIVSSLVNDIFMPLIGMMTGGVNFGTLKLVMSPAKVDAAGTVVKEEAAVLYGSFIQNIVDFLLIAICIFVFVKLISKLHRKKAEEPAVETVTAPTSEELLAEIRDLLKAQNEVVEDASAEPEEA